MPMLLGTLLVPRGFTGRRPTRVDVGRTAHETARSGGGASATSGGIRRRRSAGCRCRGGTSSGCARSSGCSVGCSTCAARPARQRALMTSRAVQRGAHVAGDPRPARPRSSSTGRGFHRSDGRGAAAEAETARRRCAARRRRRRRRTADADRRSRHSQSIRDRSSLRTPATTIRRSDSTRLSVARSNSRMKSTSVVDAALGERVVDRRAHAADRAVALQAVEARPRSTPSRTASRGPRSPAGTSRSSAMRLSVCARAASRSPCDRARRRACRPCAR